MTISLQINANNFQLRIRERVYTFVRCINFARNSSREHVFLSTLFAHVEYLARLLRLGNDHDQPPDAPAPDRRAQAKRQQSLKEAEDTLREF
jgi:hypothetical protein